MFPMIICLIFSTCVLVQADDYEDDYDTTYTFSELKSYLNSFEDTLKEELKNDLIAFEKRMGTKQDIEVRRLERRLARRASSRVPMLLEAKVTDLVKDGTMKSFIDSTLLHQVNHLQKGLSSVKAHLRVNTADLNKIKAKEESLENYFLSSVKDLKTSVNVTRHHQMSEQCRDCQKSMMDSEIRLKKAMKAEIANFSDDLHTTTESLRNVTSEMEGVKANLSEIGRLTAKLAKYHNIGDIALVDKPAACHDIYLRNKNSVSGEYILTTNQGAAMTVWCNFRNDVITTYFSKSTIAGLTTDELSLHYNINTVVDVVAKWKVGKQTVSTLEQLWRFSNIPLRIMANEYTNYTQPSNIHFKPFIYLGFLPKKMINRNFIHGYRANGHDYTFRNCDGNPNNYFSFFVNANSQAPRTKSSTWSAYMRNWIVNAQNLGSRDYLPDKYFYETEIHFGGCGGFAITYGFPPVDGLSLGLRHSK